MVELDASRFGEEGQGRPFDRYRIRTQVSSRIELVARYNLRSSPERDIRSNRADEP